MQIKTYKDLIVWQKAMDLAEQTYKLTKGFPKEETYGLTSQLRRAVVSVPSNIAEGQARQSTAEFKNFLSIAQGSLAEVETQLLLAIRFEYLTQQQAAPALSLREEISKMLASLRSKLGN
jgi:four helix bundle protein